MSQRLCGHKFRLTRTCAVCAIERADDLVSALHDAVWDYDDVPRPTRDGEWNRKRDLMNGIIWKLHDVLRPHLMAPEGEALIEGDTSLIPESIREDMFAMVAEMRDPGTKPCGCGYPGKPCLRIMLRNGPPFPPRPCEPV